MSQLTLINHGVKSRKFLDTLDNDNLGPDLSVHVSALWERRGDQTNIKLKLILSNSGAFLRVFWV